MAGDRGWGYWLRVLTFVLSLALVMPVFAADRGESISDWPVLSLQDALKLGLERNFDMKVAALNIPIGRQDVAAADAVFDFVADASFSAQKDRTPTSLVLTGDDLSRQRTYSAGAGIGKTFRAGLSSRLGVETSRTSDNSGLNNLDPEYRSALVLDMTQPLLRDFGTAVNTTEAADF